MKIINAAILFCFALVKDMRLFVFALPLTFLMISSPAAALPSSLVRIMGIVESMSSQLIELVIAAVVVGLLVIGDRRRRSRARSLAS